MSQEILQTHVRIDDLELGVFSPRKVFSQAYIALLAESIKREGQLKPIIVRSSKPDIFEVVDGEHRVKAFKKLSKTLIRAEVRKLSEEEAALLAISVNEKHGKRLEMEEEALHIKKLHEQYGLTLREIASKLNKSLRWVQDRWTLATRLGPKTMKMYSRGYIKGRKVRKISQLPKEEQDLIVNVVPKLTVDKTEALVEALKEAPTQEEKERILSKPLEVYQELVTTPEAFQRLVETAPSAPVIQRFDCPCGCGYNLSVNWVEKKGKWFKPGS